MNPIAIGSKKVDVQHLYSDRPQFWTPGNPANERYIRYNCNESGYRCDEFDNLTEVWSEAIVCFGCSFTFGVGVDDSETLPVNLSMHVERPTINMGVPGGSNWHTWCNSLELIQHGIRPKAVLFQETFPHRWFFWDDRNKVYEFLDPKVEKDPLIVGWYLKERNAENWNQKVVNTVFSLWELAGVPMLHWTIDDEEFGGYKHEQARDGHHPSHEHWGRVAKILASRLHKKNID